MITIIDYGLGNIRAFVNVYARLNIETRVAYTANDLQDASKIILPGVGAFDHAITLLNASGMRETLEKLVIHYKVPVMGICVGMQILAKSSEEGISSSLGWIDGVVKKFDPATIPYKTRLPHMGWNTIHPSNDNILLKNFSDNSRFYFLHSYYFECNDSNDIIATSEYGIKFSSAVNHENIYGIQFHPEKSHSDGIHLLHKFANIL
jgi:glutamine amidotransferase